MEGGEEEKEREQEGKGREDEGQENRGGCQRIGRGTKIGGSRG